MLSTENFYQSLKPKIQSQRLTEGQALSKF